MFGFTGFYLGSPTDLLASYREVFSLFDKDSSGTISSSELATVMRSFGQKATESEIAYIMNRIDIDHNGSIDFEEFVNLMCRPELSPIAGQGKQLGEVGVDNGPSSWEEEEDAELWEAFRVFDKDGNGNISYDELSKVMESLGGLFNSLVLGVVPVSLTIHFHRNRGEVISRGAEHDDRRS